MLALCFGVLAVARADDLSATCLPIARPADALPYVDATASLADLVALGDPFDVCEWSDCGSYTDSITQYTCEETDCTGSDGSRYVAVHEQRYDRPSSRVSSLESSLTFDLSPVGLSFSALHLEWSREAYDDYANFVGGASDVQSASWSGTVGDGLPEDGWAEASVRSVYSGTGLIQTNRASWADPVCTWAWEGHRDQYRDVNSDDVQVLDREVVVADEDGECDVRGQSTFDESWYGVVGDDWELVGPDADADGFPEGEVDCDDTAPDVHACADDPLDGVDEDCDGDDGDDADGDGHVTLTNGGDDCDDDDPWIHPGAPRLCGGVDADCDGLPDDDEDADGAVAELCGGRDCDDGDAAVHPGADDPVGDGEDQDCDGADGVDTGSPAPSDTAADTGAGAPDDPPPDSSTGASQPPDSPGGCDTTGATHRELPPLLALIVASGAALVARNRRWLVASALLSGGCVGQPDGKGDTGAGERSTVVPGLGLGGAGGWYTDLDGDGFGAGARRAGPPVPGLAVRGGDCDDAEAAVHPGAVELCDGRDQNCDPSDTEAPVIWDGNASELSLGETCEEACGVLVNGRLEVYRMEEGDLHELSCVLAVRDELRLEESDGLVTLSGLERVETVGGSLIVELDDQLPSLDGLGALRSVGGDLRVTFLGPGASLRGLDALATVGGDVSLRSVEFATLEGLDGLVTVGGSVGIYTNGALESFGGLGSLTSIEGSLAIYENDSLASLAGAGALERVGGDVYIHDNPLLADEEARRFVESIAEIGGQVEIAGNGR